MAEGQAATAMPELPAPFPFPFPFPSFPVLVLLLMASTALVLVATKASQALHAEEGHVLVAAVEKDPSNASVP
jgi:hypothetical protein